MKINFIFLRHSFGCHNAISPLYKNNLLKIEDALKFQNSISNDETKNKELFIDPELTQIGVDASAYNGCIISKTIREIGFEAFKNDEFSSINMVGCSPLIRSMETAKFMTQTWSQTPDKIYVFPYLRELDEGSSDKYSKESQITMDTNPSYAMKSIPEQKNYLKSISIDDTIDFKYVENNLPGRSEAGDIPKFIDWFIDTFVDNIEPVDKLNVFIITHAGVLTDFVKTNISEKSAQGFYNNSGFIISTVKKNDMFYLDKYIPLNSYLPKTFFKDYSKIEYMDSKYYCPSQRCSNFCKYIDHDKNKTVSKIDLPNCKNENNKNLKVKKK